MYNTRSSSCFYKASGLRDNRANDIIQETVGSIISGLSISSFLTIYWNQDPLLNTNKAFLIKSSLGVLLTKLFKTRPDFLKELGGAKTKTNAFLRGAFDALLMASFHFAFANDMLIMGKQDRHLGNIHYCAPLNISNTAFWLMFGGAFALAIPHAGLSAVNYLREESTNQEPQEHSSKLLRSIDITGSTANCISLDYGILSQAQIITMGMSSLCLVNREVRFWTAIGFGLYRLLTNFFPGISDFIGNVMNVCIKACCGFNSTDCFGTTDEIDQGNDSRSAGFLPRRFLDTEVRDRALTYGSLAINIMLVVKNSSDAGEMILDIAAMTMFNAIFTICMQYYYMRPSEDIPTANVPAGPYGSINT